MRADLAVVQAGLCGTRTQARQLIEAGSVFLGKGTTSVCVRKPAQEIIDPKQLRIESEEPAFVSRGGIKLYHALKASGLNPEGCDCVDFGQSTGGFTDCLLQHGAKSVTGFDVGHDQLHSSLANNPKVGFFEGVNLKDIDAELWTSRLQSEYADRFPFSLAVADLSFISLQRVLPGLLSLLKGPAECLFLVKPQFELGPEYIGKKGLVKEASDLSSKLQDDTFRAVEALGGTPVQFFACAIRGGDGNQEYFVHAQWPGHKPA